MASNQTPVYGLNQWSLEDSVIMAEFNADNAKIEQALLDLKAGLPKFQAGSITVTEQYKENAPLSYTFDFPPKAILLVQGDSETTTLSLAPTIMLRDVTKMRCCYDPHNYTNYNTAWMYITWEGNTVSWYIHSHYFHPATYHFLAIG